MHVHVHGTVSAAVPSSTDMALPLGRGCQRPGPKHQALKCYMQQHKVLQLCCDSVRPRWCCCSSLMFSSSAALSTRLMLALMASSASGAPELTEVDTSAPLDRLSDLRCCKLTRGTFCCCCCCCWACHNSACPAGLALWCLLLCLCCAVPGRAGPWLCPTPPLDIPLAELATSWGSWSLCPDCPTAAGLAGRLPVLCSACPVPGADPRPAAAADS